MSVYVHTGGREGGGPALVFVHGAGEDHTIWRFQTRWLAHRGYRVLAPDLPGHGRSGGPGFESIVAGAGWLGEFLTGRLPAPATVVGHSMGALIALEAAATDPTPFARLVLVGSGRRLPVHPRLQEAAAEDLPLAAALIAAWSMPGADRGGHPEPGTWQQGGILRLAGRSRPGVLAADLAACNRYQGPTAWPGVPTVVVSGAEDRMLGPEAAPDLARAIPGAVLHLMEGCGHDPMVEAPRLFNRLLIEVLQV